MLAMLAALFSKPTDRGQYNEDKLTQPFHWLTNLMR